jgi:hypothetical protein
MARTGFAYVNLTTTDEPTEWIPVMGSNKFSCEIIPASGYTWSTAVVDLQWTLCPENENANAFSPVYQATTSAKYITNASVTNRGYVRLKPSTAEAANDGAAKVQWQMR